MYAGCTRNAYHLYMFRYDKSQFAGLPRAAFLKALAAEGVPASGGYRPLNTEPFLKEALSARGYQRLFPAKALAEWEERNRCPVNDRLCEEAVWFSQTVLLAPRRSMELIADAIRKLQVNADRLPKGRGRDSDLSLPPARTRAGAISAHGSYLGCEDIWRRNVHRGRGAGLGPMARGVPGWP